MFDFNKRESTTIDSDKESPGHENPGSRTSAGAREAVSDGNASAAVGDRSEAAVIGATIRIDGDLRGEEDLRVQGQIKGTVRLKKNSLTIGSQGKVSADVYANTIYVDGIMEGDLIAAERICIRKTAQMRGNIIAPRVSLEDGAKFKGSIEMDPDAEALKSAFGNKQAAPKNVSTAQAQASKPAAASTSQETNTFNKSDKVSGKVAAK